MQTETQKPRIVVTRKLPEAIETRIAQLFECQLNPSDEPMTQDELHNAITWCDALCPTITDKIDHDLLKHAGNNLKLIANYGAGIDHIDLKTAHAKGIVITNTPDVLSEDTAELAMTLILSLLRRLKEGEQRVRNGVWRGWRPTSFVGRRLKGKRLGIIGLGRNGMALAKLAKNFGMIILYHNRSQLPQSIEDELRSDNQQENTYYPKLEDMLAITDIVTVCCPYTPETHHLLNAQRLACLAPDSIVINTSRGGIIDENALADLLENHQLGGAGLDVHEHEPTVNQRLQSLDNVILLPHMGAATFEARHEMGETLIVNVRAFFDGHTPPNRVIEDME